MKIVDISIKRKVTVTMFTIAVILFGVVSFSRLKLNLLPELTYPTLTVRTEYVGAAPLEVENLISKPIEERLGVVKNVLNITSISSAGRSDVTLEFAWGTDMDFAGLDIREKLDMIYFPNEAKRPLILRYNPSMEPILRYGLYTSQKDSKSKDSLSFDEPNLKRLRKIADEDIKRAIEIIPGIASVKISGGLEDEITIVIDQGKTAQLNLSIEQISNILALENINYSGGILEEGINQYLVRTVNQFQSLDDIKKVVIGQKENSPIYLKDIADIKLTHKKRDTITRLDGKESVEIAIYKEGDANTVSVAKDIKNKLEKFKEKLPANIEIQKIYDQSLFISDSVNEVINAGIFGGILAIFILYFFLKNFWITFITSLSIPISVIATFNLMYSNNITLNIMSLGGITLGIGMLLDNSIVVLENVSRHREEGMGIIKSAQKGASEVGMAVTASTFTTVAVFFPLVFVKGIAGQLFKDQALTVTFSLLASLVVAVTLIPMLASIKISQKNNKFDEVEKKVVTGFWNRFGFYIKKILSFIFVLIPYYIIFSLVFIFNLMGKVTKKIITPALSLFDYCYNFVSKMYPIILKWALSSKLTVIFIAVLLFSYAIFLFPKLGIELTQVRQYLIISKF